MKVLVARASDLQSGDRVIVEVGNRSIGVFRRGDDFFAVRNTCPHLGAPLCLGKVHPLVESDWPGVVRDVPGRQMLACPWHGWEFDLANGKSYGPGANAKAYAVSVESGLPENPTASCETARHIRDGKPSQLREGPYLLETFPVAVEDDYVMLDMPGDNQIPAQKTEDR
jgi:nitrite reductase/ring-hydroxylating ferredoxin subunit